MHLDVGSKRGEPQRAASSRRSSSVEHAHLRQLPLPLTKRAGTWASSRQTVGSQHRVKRAPAVTSLASPPSKPSARPLGAPDNQTRLGTARGATRRQSNRSRPSLSRLRHRAIGAIEPPVRPLGAPDNQARLGTARGATPVKPLPPFASRASEPFPPAELRERSSVERNGARKSLDPTRQFRVPTWIDPSGGKDTKARVRALALTRTQFAY
jgi:hypothetical protein